MPTILIQGLGANVGAADVRSWLDRFGPVERVEIIREGSPDHPSALVDMDINDKAAEYLAFRIGHFCHVSASVRARLLKV